MAAMSDAAALHAAAPALIGARVRVHVNLRRGDLSISTRGRVVASAHSLALTDVRFIVHESTRRRVVERGRRKVHAWAEGVLQSVGEPVPAGAAPVSYNPHRAPDFIANGEPVHAAPVVHFGARRGWIAD